MKKIFCALLTAMIMSTSLTAFATQPITNNQEVAVVSDGVSFDLTNRVKQEQSIIIDGQECTVGIEPVGKQTRANYDLSDGQWHIYWYGVAINFEYFIYIENGKIVDAYDPSVFTLAWTLESDELSFTPLKASYEIKADCKISDFGFSYSGGLYAKIINGDTLNTYIR